MYIHWQKEGVVIYIQCTWSSCHKCRQIHRSINWCGETAVMGVALLLWLHAVWPSCSTWLTYIAYALSWLHKILIHWFLLLGMCMQQWPNHFLILSFLWKSVRAIALPALLSARIMDRDSPFCLDRACSPTQRKVTLVTDYFLKLDRYEVVNFPSACYQATCQIC